MTQLLIEVPDEFIHLIENNEVIELVNRAANGQFAEFMKIVVKDMPEDNKAELLQAVMNASSLAALSSTASLLAAGVGFASLAVNIVGFKMINGKLDDISTRIDAVKERVDKIDDKMKYLLFEKDLDILDSETINIVSNIKSKKEISQTNFQTLIRNYQHYFCQIYKRQNDIPLEEYLEIYYNLAPIYTNLIVMYYQMGYAETLGKKDALHVKWLEVFDKNTSDTFMCSMQDYYILEKHRHNKDVNLIMKGHLDVNQAMHAQIEDTITLMRYVKSAEEYQKFMDAVQKAAVKKAKEELAPEIYKIYSKEKANQVLENATG